MSEPLNEIQKRKYLKRLSTVLFVCGLVELPIALITYYFQGASFYFFFAVLMCLSAFCFAIYYGKGQAGR